ncbi:ABC transporter permease [Telmatospirillum siberiense]|uniref:ABC transporter permease n=2 Tax=Telmatospirillum siberiense TaxID=382514 RepID=A0A2N3PUA6_9PROT|nr:ABC transporter permease [Telmatospirillum siberiense]
MAPPVTRTAAFGRRLRPFAFLATLVAAWELVCRFWLPVLDPQFSILLPSPSVLLLTAGKMIATGELLHHLADSLRREAIAFLLALVAVPVGIGMGWWRGLHEQLYPVFEILRPIPPLAWIPLSILWFGLGDVQNEFIIFLGMVFPILLNTVAGVRQVDRNLIRAARSLGAGQAALLRRVVLKAALPQIVIGLRVGLGFGWMALVAAELVGANSGLGFLINDARSLLRTDIVIVGMLAIGITGLIIDLALRRLARGLLPWSRELRG